MALFNWLAAKYVAFIRWAIGPAFERRFALLESDAAEMHYRVLGFRRPERDSLLFVDTADWCGKRHKFVTNVRVIDKAGTRRVNVLVDSLDEVAIRKALADKAGA